MEDKIKKTIHKKFGEIAEEKFGISKGDIESALDYQREINLRIGEILLSKGVITEEQVTNILSLQFQFQILFNLINDITDLSLEVVGEINEYWFLNNEVLPAYIDKDKEKKLYFIIKDPTNTYAIELIKNEFNDLDFSFLLVDERTWQLLETSFIQENIKKNKKEIYEDEIEKLKDMASNAPIIKLVNSTISKAVESGASDIHFENLEDKLIIRYRIDGVLHIVDKFSIRLSPAIISRVKILSNLDIGEKRLPQDGRIDIKVAGRNLNIRVSTIPDINGENVVMRLLEKEESINYSLSNLGLEETDYQKLSKMIKNPFGIILVTGPTGSGKSTTLYSILKTLLTPEKKIMTVEDPIEYKISGITQIQVQSEIGLTFANVLRSILRQDPDIIMIGEIRDKETAEIAVQAALTGHLVFSTLHTNDAPSAVTRLLDIGIADYLINSTIIGVIAQRLVRTICPECKTKIKIDDILFDELKDDYDVFLKIKTNKGEGLNYSQGKGCAFCGYKGYKGRIAAFEIMEYGTSLKKALIQEGNYIFIRETAIKEGLKTLRKAGLKKWEEGTTTLEEVFRVT